MKYWMLYLTTPPQNGQVQSVHAAGRVSRAQVQSCKVGDVSELTLRIHASLVAKCLAFHLLVLELLARACSRVAEMLHMVDGEDGKTEAVCFVANRELQRGVNVALLLVTSNVHVLLTRALCRS